MLPQSASRAELLRRPALSPTAPPPIQGFEGIGGRSSLAQSLQLMGAVMSFSRNSEIFGENEPADYVYRVVSGSVRTYKILHDGRRQIVGFYLPGDIFGLEFADTHTFSAEAIADARVVVAKRSALMACASRDAAIGRELFALAGREIRCGSARCF